MGSRRVNLCFHGVGTPGRTLEDGEARYWITPAVFEGVLDAVADRPDVSLSFDDGNASDVELGLPALRSRGLRATFFVLAGRLDRPGSLSSDQVRELVAAGMTVGSHGMDHVPWRGLVDDAARRELVEARDRLAEVAGRPVGEAALPLGRYDRRLLARLRGLGYRTVFTSDRRPARTGQWLQPRYSLRDDDTPASVEAGALAPAGAAAFWPAELKGLLKRLR